MSANENVTPVLVSFRQQRAGAMGCASFGAVRGDHEDRTRFSRPPRLTPRELEVLALLACGLPNKLIARRLGISASTVKCHVANIFRELDVLTRVQAVVAAIQNRLVDLDDDSDDATAAMARVTGAP